MNTKKQLGARSLQSLSEDAAMHKFLMMDRDEADEIFADLDARTQQLLLSRFFKERNRLKADNSKWKGYEDNCPLVDNEVYTDHTVDLSKGKYKGRPKQEAEKTLSGKKEVAVQGSSQNNSILMEDSAKKEPVGKSPEVESPKATGPKATSLKAKSTKANNPKVSSPKAKNTKAKSPKAKSTQRNYLLRQLEIDENTENEALSFVRVTRSNTKLRNV